MKILKPLITVLAVLQISSVTAQSTDPVVNQINITKDAVQLALEEFSQGKIDLPASYDAQLKVKAFNEEASKLLVNFERDVRQGVLQSLSVLVKQYNQIVGNKNIDATTKKEMLSNLRDQLKVITRDKSYVYRGIYLKLLSVLPELPVYFDHLANFNGSLFYDKVQKNAACFNSLTNCYLLERYKGEIYFTKSGLKNVDFTLDGDYNNGDYYNKDIRLFIDHAAKTGIMPTRDDVRTIFLQGCYTSACYFAMQGQYTVWTSLVESSLARDIEIVLNDGEKLTISRKISRNDRLTNLLNTYLTQVQTEGLINNLPFEASEDRVNIMFELDKALSVKPSCKNISKLKDRLCQETSEGCIKETEVELFKDRFGANKVSCLTK